MYVEDLKRGTNKDIGPKDIFVMASNKMTPQEFTTRTVAGLAPNFMLAKYNRLLAIRHYETSYIFPAPEECHLARVTTAGSELTHLPLFHMVHPSTQACRRAILTAGEMAVQWKNTAMFW